MSIMGQNYKNNKTLQKKKQHLGWLLFSTAYKDTL